MYIVKHDHMCGPTESYMVQCWHRLAALLCEWYKPHAHCAAEREGEVRAAVGGHAVAQHQQALSMGCWHKGPAHELARGCATCKPAGIQMGKGSGWQNARATPLPPPPPAAAAGEVMRGQNSRVAAGLGVAED